MRLVGFLFLCACATEKAAVVPPMSESCAHAYELCNNQCFRAPNYKHAGPKCTDTEVGSLCPQENQLVDTVEAGKCFEKCDWDAKLCR